MKKPADPVAELARRLAENAEPDGEEDAAAEPDDPEAAEYRAALAEAREASAEFERATASFAQARDQLARLTPPWVATAVHMVLWLVALAAAFAAAGGGPLALSVTLAAAAVFSGDAAGEGARLALRGPDLRRMGAGAALLVFGLGVGAAALLASAPALVTWTPLALILLFFAAAATLPWLGGGREHYARLAAKVEAALTRQVEALRRAQKAADRLDAVHAALTARHWGRDRRPNR